MLRCVQVSSTKGRVTTPKYVVEIGKTYLKLFPSKTPITRLKKSNVNQYTTPMTYGRVLLHLVNMWRDAFREYTYTDVGDNKNYCIASCALWMDAKAAETLCNIFGATGTPIVFESIIRDAQNDDFLPFMIFRTDGDGETFSDQRPPVIQCLMHCENLEKALELVEEWARTN